MAEVARKFGVAAQDPGPEPDEEQVPCSLCGGVGVASAGRIAEVEARSQFDTDRMKDEMVAVARRMSAFEDASAPEPSPPTLRVVD